MGYWRASQQVVTCNMHKHLGGNVTDRTAVLVDPHPSIRLGLRAVLAEAGFSVIGEGDDMKSDRALVRDLRPTLLIMEAMLPDGDGIAMGAEVQRSRSGTRVLVLTAQAQESLCRRAQELGISACVLKQQDVGELVEALDRLAAGERMPQTPRRSADRRSPGFCSLV
jgi:two-component system, NarL family, response regulator EvgA